MVGSDELQSVTDRTACVRPQAFVMNLLLKWARGEAGRGEKPVRSTEKVQPKSLWRYAFSASPTAPQFLLAHPLSRSTVRVTHRLG